MKIDFKKWFKKEAWIDLTREFKRRLLRLPKWLLIKHGHALTVIAVILVILFSFVLIVKTLFLKPSGVFIAPVEKASLSTSSISQITKWMEVKEVEKEKELDIADDIFELRL
jgi:hypothetical protein